MTELAEHDVLARLASVQEDLCPREMEILIELIDRAKYNSAGERVQFDPVSIVSSYLKTYTDVDENLLATNARNIRADNVPRMVKDYPGRPFVPFPAERVELARPFKDVIEQRQSVRDFIRAPIELAELATILETGYGVKGHATAYGVRGFPLRTAPNAGGLQSVEVYVVAFDVTGLEPGVYYFNADRHGLVQLDRGLMRRRMHQVCLFLQEWISTAGAVLVLTCGPEKLFWKYGKKAYRMTHMDAGVVADHLHLVASAIGLGSCVVSGMFDQEAARLLGVDGRSEFPTLNLCLGKTQHG